MDALSSNKTIENRNESHMISPTGASRPRAASTASSAKTKRKSTSLPPETVEYLKNWMMSPDHIAHPYPTEVEKVKIMQDTGIELKQLTNWFVNNRKRYWKPRVEARLHEQTKGKDLTPPKKSLPEVSSPARSSPVSPMTKDCATVVSTSSLTTKDKSHRNGTTPARDVTPYGSPSRAVSEPSSAGVSDSSSISSCSDEEVVCEEVRTIRIDLHVLKAMSGRVPTVADMTTLDSLPAERILRTFKDIEVTYRIPPKASLKKEHSRRDGEIMRLKKTFLGMYFAEQEAAPQKRPTDTLLELLEHGAPRTKYRRVSINIWKDACKDAHHVYDTTLPSLEEAAQLFGYASN